jgi:hypothetical protein
MPGRLLPYNGFSKIAFSAAIIIGFFACEPTPDAQQTATLFRSLSVEQSGVNFNNVVEETETFNLYTYNYIYDGSGVAIGDINNDGLMDLYFTGNASQNKLFLNQGDLTFKDITESAGVGGDDRWMTGTTMADVNDDGFLDIYISVAGPTENRRNILFINQGNMTFKDEADTYGVADNGASNQATFFDYDKDGDLDMYLVNRPVNFDISRNAFLSVSEQASDTDTDKLYKFVDGVFIDATDEAGVRAYDYGQSVTIGDLNNDGWPDLYVSGDFQTPDFMYINNGDGTFTDRLTTFTGHVSFSAMGTDIADINNDGLLDIMELDMVAEDHVRKKTMMGAMAPAAFWETVNQGYHFQYMFNTLQLNNGNNTFSEIAKLAGISETDWSWSPLLADLDDDGWKDLFVTNGIIKDVNDNDYNNTINKQVQLGVQIDFLEVNENMPSQELSNYAFKNNRDLTFSNQALEWGLDLAGFSYGSAYADLDNDGDLDLVINNMNSAASVYENQTDHNTNGYLNLRFAGSDDNKFGIGVRVEIEAGGHQQIGELTLSRGYLSSVAPEIHFGLGSAEIVDSVKVIWPNGKVELLNDVEVNQTITIEQTNATAAINQGQVTPRTLFTNVTSEVGLNFRHQENEYNDYLKQVLLPYKLSKMGPGMATGDANGDGLDDVFVTGALGQPGVLFLQRPDGSFNKHHSNVFTKDMNSEGMDALFLDIDNDGDNDLYVVNGGNEYVKNSAYYQDRLYLNDGKGNFSPGSNRLPDMTISGARVKASDIDNDGDLDLFVAGRHTPWEYPQPTSSVILINNHGSFINATADIAPDLINIGMVTDAIWSDFDGDQDKDLVLVGEWMPLTVLENKDGKFKQLADTGALSTATGWWFSIAEADLDNDGDIDYVSGNLGLNYRYRASVDNPFLVYAQDFDNNGSMDIVLGYDDADHSYPIRGRQCSSQQSAFVTEKFPDYKSFATATMADIYGREALDNSYQKKVTTFASNVWLNQGNGAFKAVQLPNKAQISSVNNILIKDLNGDNNKDLILTGNLYSSEEESPRNDASIGLILLGNGDGTFEPVPPTASGFSVFKDVKAMEIMSFGDCELVITVSNNDTIDALKFCEK